MTNDFYDKSETHHLGLPVIRIAGETSRGGVADFSMLPKRSVHVKEAVIDRKGTNRFKGAYRYDGYSLFDILNTFIPEKSNTTEFSSVIDLIAEVENQDGEKVVFSWGEIYYPVSLHRIIVATDVTAIVPVKTGELWPLPSRPMIVAANDLLTERNITSPETITIRSFRRSFTVDRSTAPRYSPFIGIFEQGNPSFRFAGQEHENENTSVTYNTIFYGRGRGIHSTKPFTGIMLKDILKDRFPLNRNNIRQGALCIAGTDGYRCVVSYSELFNRNDQQEFLLVDCGEQEGGRFRIFPASDFFSDRAIKSVSEIHFESQHISYIKSI